MRKLVATSIIAAFAATTFGTAAFADGVTVRLGDGPDYHRHHHPRVIERVDEMHHHRHDCMTKTVVRHEGGERIVKKTRICH